MSASPNRKKHCPQSSFNWYDMHDTNDIIIAPQSLEPLTSDITFDASCNVSSVGTDHKTTYANKEGSPLLRESTGNRLMKLQKEYSAITDSNTSVSLTPGVSDLWESKSNQDCHINILQRTYNWLLRLPESFWTSTDASFTSRFCCFSTSNGSVSSMGVCSIISQILMVLVGSTLYALYNLVFCLAMASSITVPYRSKVTMLGPIAKLCTMGVVAGAPLLLWGLSSDHPALYPVFDLFLAPFLADIATTVDATLYEQSLSASSTSITGSNTTATYASSESNADQAEKYSDGAFLVTYAFILSIGLFLTAIVNFLGSHVKLANIGEYLPYPVLCGFFSTVGVTLWTLAIAIDTGKSIQHIVSSRNWDFLQYALYHHLPSALMGILMFIFGPSNKLFVIALVLTVILGSYAVMLVFHIPLQHAQENNWFWRAKDLTVTRLVEGNLEPYEPFGVLYGALFTNLINYEAVLNAVPHLIAMSVIYTLRYYLFASAFRKSAAGAWEYIHQKESTAALSSYSQSILHGSTSSVNASGMPHRRQSSLGTTQAGVLEEISLLHLPDNPANKSFGHEIKKAPLPRISKTLSWCNATLMLLASVGTGGGVLPGIGISPSLLKIGVEGLAPQLTSILLMTYFYATDMSVIAFIPKIAFSCLLVLSSINILNLWFVSSYFKMRQKEEWLVVPLIVAFYFMFDMLRAIALGVALSTFIFVASFYRTGTVKLMSTGSIIRSTVARTKKDAEWLNKNGDLIQILVLQTYLFFGNASSCLNYIEKIFGENSEKEKANGVVSFPLIPKYLIIDLSLVTGIDASTADVFSDAFSICKANSCYLFLVGVTSCIKSALTCGGFKPASSDRCFRFISNLEAALGRAEDGILTDILKAEEIDRRNSVARRRIRLMSLGSDSGFGYALEQIDQQHELAFAPHLLGLEKYVHLVEIEVGQHLYRSDGGIVGNNDRGLFFIETGLLRVERDPQYSTHSHHLKDNIFCHKFSRPSMKKSSGSRIPQSQSKCTKFRLARIGPGFVVGGVEMSTGLQDPGIHLAITKCRLHHLSYSKMAEIEESEPLLMLYLYKLLAHLVAYREQQAIEQLSTMYSIVGTAPQSIKYNI